MLDLAVMYATVPHRWGNAPGFHVFTFHSESAVPVHRFCRMSHDFGFIQERVGSAEIDRHDQHLAEVITQEVHTCARR